MFLQPGINVPQLRQAAEGIKYGTVMDPHKNKDPKEQGRVKTRILELHGPGSAGMIPDSDIPWSQNERDNSFGGQEEMSTFGLPQKNSMIKARHHSDSKYSPIYSGAVYGTMSKIKEWSSGKKAKDGSGGDDGFNQKDHYGHKDPLGNLYHADMKTKTLTIDHTKFSEVIWKLPKVTFDVQHTKHDRNTGTFEDGSPSHIQGQGQKPDTPPAKEGPQVNGDVTWTVAGKHDKTIGDTKSVKTAGDVTENFQKKQSTTVGDTHTVTNNADHSHSVGGSYTRSASQDTNVSGGQSRTDTYQKSWSSSAKNTAWSWLTSLNILSG